MSVMTNYCLFCVNDVGSYCGHFYEKIADTMNLTENGNTRIVSSAGGQNLFLSSVMSFFQIRL